MEKDMERWVAQSFRLWLVCKVAAILFWMLLVGVPLSILLVMVVVSLLS